jgi:hypothetical protein
MADRPSATHRPCHSGMVRRTRPGISRFRVRCSASPRNDVDRYDIAFSRRDAPEFCKKPYPPENQRAQGKPGTRCTRGLACNRCIKMRTRAYRFSGGTPTFPAQWLYGLLRAHPGERALLSPSLPDGFESLTPASRHQVHTTSPYAFATLVSRSLRVHRSPSLVCDDGQRPSGGTGWRNL